MNLPLMLEKSLTAKDGGFQPLHEIERTFTSLIQIDKIVKDGPLAAHTHTIQLNPQNILQICGTIIKKPNSWPIINFLLKNKEIPIADKDIYERLQTLVPPAYFQNEGSTSTIMEASFFGLAILSKNLEAVRQLLSKNPSSIYKLIFLVKNGPMESNRFSLSMVDERSKKLLSNDITSPEIYNLITFRVKLETIVASQDPITIRATINDLFKKDKALLIDTISTSDLNCLFQKNYQALFNVIQEIRSCLKQTQRTDGETFTTLKELSNFEQKILPKLEELPKDPLIDNLIAKLKIKSALPTEKRYENKYGLSFYQAFPTIINTVPAAIASETATPTPLK